MVRLALEQAPAPAAPARFLRSVPAWGMLAGLMLLVQGTALLQSRWAPATVALVHVVTLGVLGNAMFGSLLQFLPAAAGVHVRGGPHLPPLLHALLNGGALALVAGLLWPSAGLRAAGAAMLGLAFVLLVSATLPGVLAKLRGSLLHAGIALSLLAGLATAVLGMALVAALAGALAIPVVSWTDLHAAAGVLAWVLVLLVAVGRVVMPMFQGTPPAPAALQAAWLATVLLGLPFAGAVWICAGHPVALRLLSAALLLSMACGNLWLQSRSRRSVPGALAGFWRVGSCALALSAGLLFFFDDQAVLVGVLVLGIGLPMPVLGMALEISAFLGWIELHRRCGRGLQLPGVQVLLPMARRRQVLRLFGLAAAGLTVAALTPDVAARGAGALLFLANVALALALHGIDRGVRGFAAIHAPH